MKRFLALALALVMIFSFCSCSSKKLEGVENPVDILNKVWDSYAEDDKFPALGGDYSNMVDNAPGTVNISDADTMLASFACNAEALAMIDDAASLVHMMNANTFTAVSYHVADGFTADQFAEAMKTATANQQWLCGSPEQLLIATLSDEYVVVAYGSVDAVSPFNVYLCAAFPTTETTTLSL